MKPSFLNPEARYRELNANLRSRSRPSVPFIRDVGRVNQVGKLDAGAGPYTFGRDIIDILSESSLGVARGGAIPMIDPIEARI